MKAMQKDLAAAVIPYKDEQGRQADFHALRGSLCTHLAVHGIDPHTRKEIMRHSELSLTLKNYTDVRQLKTSESIRVLPSFIPHQYAHPCAHDLGAGRHNVAQAGTKAANERLAEETGFEPVRHDLAPIGTAGHVHKNGSSGRIRTYGEAAQDQYLTKLYSLLSSLDAGNLYQVARIVAGWKALPEDIKTAVLAIIGVRGKATNGEKRSIPVDL